jgi:hypothetical protein
MVYGKMDAQEGGDAGKKGVRSNVRVSQKGGGGVYCTREKGKVILVYSYRTLVGVDAHDY